MTQSFSVGSIECRILQDGRGAFPPEQLFVGVDPALLEEEVRPHVDQQGNVPTYRSCLLVRSGGRTALIDTGLGDTTEDWGIPPAQLTGQLEEAGVDQPDLVVISHAHPDHIGGLTLAAEEARLPAFPVPTYFWEDEWAFWTDESSLEQLPDLVAGPARKHLPVLAEAGLVETVSEEVDVLPGVRLVPAPGHTPGHMAVVISSGGEGAIYFGDAAYHQLDFEHPEWVSVFDAIPSLTVQTRRKLISRAVRENRVVVVYHIPVRGRVVPAGDAYRFDPVSG